MRSYISYVAALILGVLTCWSFAPWRLWFLMPIALLGLLLLGEFYPNKRRSLAYVWGISAYASQFFWIYYSLHDVGGMPSIMSGLMTLILPAFLALYPMFSMIIVHRLTQDHMKAFRLILVWPAIWVWSEYLRNHLLSGFGWGEVGYSMIPQVWLSGWAPIGGILLVSWSLVTVVGMLAYAIVIKHRTVSKMCSLVLLMMVFVLVSYAVSTIQWTKNFGKPLWVALVQPNIEQNLKWDPLHAQDTLDEIQRIVSHEYVDLMVFPESVFPIVWEQLPVNYRKNLIAMARDKHMSILAGVMMRKPYLANASMLITEDRFPWQAKHHLVPFGEYVPLPWLTQWIYRYLNIPFSDIQEGSPTRHPIRTLGQALGTHICYENGFGDELMSLNRQSSILVNLSNLAWFGRSHALGQHLQISQSRALESGRYLIQATNNGATAVINDRGHIIATTPFHQKAILKHYVEGRQHDTPYLIWGSWPVLIWSWIVILLSLGIRRFYKGVKS